MNECAIETQEKPAQELSAQICAKTEIEIKQNATNGYSAKTKKAEENKRCT